MKVSILDKFDIEQEPIKDENEKINNYLLSVGVLENTTAKDYIRRYKNERVIAATIWGTFKNQNFI